ncbi:MAG: hypothetical protein KH138_05730, partial [Firmicutes bacterium]|nr:hypothetical protein [Bacillota bacterium]
CKNYNVFSGCCANSLHCYLVYCFDLILCRHYLTPLPESLSDIKNNLSVNQALAVHNVGGMRLAIRASTYSTPGYATMAVDGANRIINVR